MVGLVVGLLACGTTLAGCSGTSDAGPDEPSSTSATSSTAPTPSTSSSPSTGDSPVVPPATSSGVAPATGKLVELDGLSVRLPEGWKLNSSDDSSLFSSDVDGALVDSLAIRFQDNFGDQESFAALIKLHNGTEMFYQRNPETLTPVTIAGFKMFHLAGQVSDSSWAEAFGADLPASLVDISFIFAHTTDPAQRQQIVDSVLASIEID